MSAGTVGFFLGVAPGLAFTLWNLGRAQRAVNEAQRTAREHGAMLGLTFSPSSRFYYLFRPAKFIRPHDSEGICQAKAQLLAMRKLFLRRHVLGGLLVVLGGFVGVGIALGVAPSS